MESHKRRCKRRRGFRFSHLRPINGRWQRRSARGRRVNAVCFHGHYKFIRAIFKRSPEAYVHTCLATYHGADSLRREAVKVAETNIGSMLHPIRYGDACACSAEDCIDAVLG